MHMYNDYPKHSGKIAPKDRRGYGAARLPKEMPESDEMMMEYPAEPTDASEFKTKPVKGGGSY